MNYKKILFFQNEGDLILSNFEIYNFCNYLVSLNYRLQFIKSVVDIIKEEKPEFLVLFRNKKNLKFENLILNFGNEEVCKQIKDFGEFDSIYPNLKVFQLNLLYKFFDLGSRFVRELDENFNRDWSLKKITSSFIDKNFEENIDYIDTIFRKELLRLKLTEMFKAIDNYKYNILEENRIYSNKVNQFYNEEIPNPKIRQSHINDTLKIISNNQFPQILLFNFNENHFKNYSFNDFFVSKNFDIRKVSHQSPWIIEVLSLPTTQVFVFLMGITTMWNYVKNIQKNSSDIAKNKREKKEKFSSKITAFIDSIEKSNSELKILLEDIEKISDRTLKNEILAVFEKITFEFEKEVKKVRMKIKITDITTFN